MLDPVSELPSPAHAYLQAITRGWQATVQPGADYWAALQVMSALYERAYDQAQSLHRDPVAVAPSRGRCLGSCCQDRTMVACRPPVVAEAVVATDDDDPPRLTAPDIIAALGPMPGNPRDDMPTWLIYEDDGEAD